MTTVPTTGAEFDTAAHPTGVELTPLADYLAGVLRGLRPLPALDLDLTQAHGNVLADDVHSPGPMPAYDHAAIDGYAARFEDVMDASASRPVRLNVIGDLGSGCAGPATRSRAARCWPGPART
jgi:molybdopterin molybdotransferase